MSWLYVRDDNGSNVGTCSDTSGKYGTQKTGTWASAFSAVSEYYATIESAITNGSPASGDYILCGNDHAASFAASGDITIPAGVLIVSVDVSDVEAYLPGASETQTTGNDWVAGVNVLVAGVSLSNADNVFNIASQSHAVLQDLTITADGAGDNGLFTFSPGQATLVNVNLNANNTTANPFTLKEGSVLWYGGSTNATDHLFDPGDIGSSGVAICKIVGVDLSTVGTLMSSTSSNAIAFHIEMHNCQLKSGVSLIDTTNLKNRHNRFEMYGCDDSSGNALYRFYILDGAGTAENNEVTYVTATESWYEGSDKSSIEVTTTSTCGHNNPFIFELPAQYVDLGDTSTDTLTIDLVSNITLTDTDIAAFLCYPDGTTMVQPNWVTSGKTVGTGNYGIDPLAAGTTLTASALGAGDWTGEPASPNFYEMVLDTSGDPGEATAISIRIEVYKSGIDGTTNKLFIHPLITVSAT